MLIWGLMLLVLWCPCWKSHAFQLPHFVKFSTNLFFSLSLKPAIFPLNLSIFYSKKDDQSCNIFIRNLVLQNFLNPINPQFHNQWSGNLNDFMWRIFFFHSFINFLKNLWIFFLKDFLWDLSIGFFGDDNRSLNHEKLDKFAFFLIEISRARIY
jgi:hypothetical protein